MTHADTNHPPPLTGHDAAADPVLLEGVEREGAGWHLEDLHRFGRVVAGEEAQHWADQANRHEPELRTHDRYGNRIDEVEFHPAYHRLMD
ncbi:DNA alkylation response protein, partial [Streptomyces hydrogenans]